MNRLTRYLVRSLLFLLLFVLLFGFFSKKLKQPLGRFSPLLGSSQKDGIVTAVFDGDTIRVKFKNGIQKKVRLIGIDSPELSASKEEVAFMAYMAKRFAFHHLYKKGVNLTYDQQLEDKYGRLLAYVWIENGFFNEFILQEGYAFVFLHFPFREDYKKKFKFAEETARKEGKGLWRKEEFERITVRDAKQHIGNLVSVVFTCKSIETKRSFVFLNSRRKRFAALIPEDFLPSFPQAKSFLNRDLLVTGFLEVYKEQPQILVYFPHQLKEITKRFCP